MNQMTPAQALAIVREACGAFKGVLADHERIQTALAVIEGSMVKKRKRTVKQPQE